MPLRAQYFKILCAHVGVNIWFRRDCTSERNNRIGIHQPKFITETESNLSQKLNENEPK